jgi:hypothetical protein
VTDQRTQIAKAIADVFSRGSYASAGDPFGLKASSLAAADAVLAVLDAQPDGPPTPTACIPKTAQMVDRAMFARAEAEHRARWVLHVWSEDNVTPGPDGSVFWAEHRARWVLHVYPLNDLVEHDTASGGACVCGPTSGLVQTDHGDEWLVIHHSLDGREQHEPPATAPAGVAPTP